MTECETGTELYRVYRKEGWKIVCAKDEASAMRRFRATATRAELVRTSSYWQEQRKLGLYPTPAMCRRRRR